MTPFPRCVHPLFLLFLKSRRSVQQKLYSELVQLVGCSNATDTFACLVEADAGDIQAANLDINNSGFSGTFVTVPVVDGEFIVERPVQTILRGKLNGVCITCSRTRNSRRTDPMLSRTYILQLLTPSKAAPSYLQLF